MAAGRRLRERPPASHLIGVTDWLSLVDLEKNDFLWRRLSGPGPFVPFVFFVVNPLWISPVRASRPAMPRDPCGVVIFNHKEHKEHKKWLPQGVCAKSPPPAHGHGQRIGCQWSFWGGDIFLRRHFSIKALVVVSGFPVL